MDDDVRTLLDAVADDPSPAFVARLEAVLADEANGAAALATGEVVLEPMVARGRPHGARGRTILAVAAAVVVAVGGLALLARDPEPQPATPPSTTATTATPPTTATTTVTTAPPSSVVGTTAAPTVVPGPAPVAPVWETLPDGPLPRRTGPLVVAAGEDVVVVGGASSPVATDGLADRRDGARLDVALGTWRTMADAPAVLGAESPAVWTGTEVVAVDRDGTAWAYTPATDAWRRVATRLGGRLWPSVAFTGTELLVAGGREPDGGPPGQGGGGPAAGGYALDVSTGRRRDLPSPGGADDLTGAARWTGREWVRATGAVDGSLAQPDRGPRIAALDPAAGRWRTLPGLPGGRSVAAFGQAGDELVAFDEGSLEWRLAAGADAWRANGARPTTGQDSVARLWAVDGRLVVDTGSNTTNGRFLGYRQASGAWRTLPGLGLATNDDVVVQLASGRLVAVTATQAARLRPWADETEGVPACRRAQLSVSVGEWFGTPQLVLTNRSTAACTVDGQRPATVAFRGADGRWTEQPIGDLVGLDARTDGGYLAPGQQALARVDGRPDPAGADGCAVRAPVDGVRFALAGGDVVEVDVPPWEGCPDLTAVMALPAAAATGAVATTACDLSIGVLVSEELVGFAGGTGRGRVLLTNVSADACRLPPLLALQRLTPTGAWGDVVAPTDLGGGAPTLVVVAPGRFAEVELGAALCDNGGASGPEGDRLRLAFEGGGTVDVRAPVFDTYGCTWRLSWPVAPAPA